MQPSLFTTAPDDRMPLTEYRPARRYENAREVLFGHYVGQYETPKKSNHSGRPIPQDVIDQLEQGVVTSEAIAGLAGSYPIYRYKTCLTIHGTWPQVQRERIGGYKNIRQNANGSLEVYWNAIDLIHKKYIANRLKLIDHPMYFSMDSRGTSFRQTRVIESKQAWDETIAEYKATIARVSKVDALVKCDVMRCAAFGRIVLELSLSVLSVDEQHRDSLLHAIANMEPGDLESRVRKAQAERVERAREQAAHREEYQRKQQDEQQERARMLKSAQDRIEHLPKMTTRSLAAGATYVLAETARNYGEGQPFRPEYKLVRYAGQGSFKRVKVVQARVLDPFNLEGVRWTESKQMNQEALEHLMKGDWREM